MLKFRQNSQTTIELYALLETKVKQYKFRALCRNYNIWLMITLFFLFVTQHIRISMLEPFLEILHKHKVK